MNMQKYLNSCAPTGYFTVYPLAYVVMATACTNVDIWLCALFGSCMDLAYVHWKNWPLDYKTLAKKM